MIILAIDPGYERVGIAIIEKQKNKDELIYSDCFKTESKTDFPQRLHKIGAEIDSLIEKYKPEILAIETLLFHTNQKTAIKVSEAKGVIVYSAVRKNLYIKEFTPLQIKNAVTGNGKSPKPQVTKMLKNLIEINKKIKYDDEFDAIAVGITCSATVRSIIPREK